MPTQSANRSAYLALVLVCIIWGTTYLVNKLGVTHMPPLFFTSVRQIIAGAVMLGFLFLVLKTPWPDLKFIKLQSILGVLLITGGNGVGIYGLQYIDSGISAILATFSPILIAFILSIARSGKQLSRMTWLGLILGSAGIILICLQKIAAHPTESSVFGITLTLISVMAWSMGSVVSKLKPHLYSPFLAAGFQMLIGGIPVFIVSLFVEKPWGFEIQFNHLMIWTYTIVLGSLVAYSCFIYCLNHLPVTLVSIHTYINPILAIFLGALILEEPVNASIITGSVITLAGVYIVSRNP